MASILRQIVAGPRLQHAETGLDLCYVADNVIATSGPSTNYPKIAYRTPLKQLVKFLDKGHDEDWCIWEFRAEGTGYPDSEVYGRIHHFPFPDHHPPPFALIPKVVASMRNWLQRLDGPAAIEGKDGEENQGQRVAVVHCKAGKGRSGTIACSYLISQEGWKMEDALQRFTERRMRVGFGSGVSIPSQLRWVRYVDRWTNELGKKYVERPVEILEVHVWGLRDGVKVAVEGFDDDGQKIKQFHMFHRNERILLPGESSQSNSNEVSDDGSSNTDTIKKADTKLKSNPKSKNPSSQDPEPVSAGSESSLWTNNLSNSSPLPSATTSTSPTAPISTEQAAPRDPISGERAETGATLLPPKSTPSNPQPSQSDPSTAVLLRPSSPLILPSSDINIDFERRSKAASYTGLAMVTSIAHVWFNPYFEGGNKYESGVFEIDWEAMDGIKGTSRKGIKALDRVKVLWRYAGPNPETEAQATQVKEGDEEKERRVSGGVITEPKPGEPIPETRVADWRLRETKEVDESLSGEASSNEDESVVEDSAIEQENVPITTRTVEEVPGSGAEKEGKDKGKD
ncbi:protein-tyrosine phosphatase-like protein [Aspergillus californicus]